MGFTAVALVLGAVVGLAAGGRFHHLADRSFAWWGLLPLGVVLQSAAEVIDVTGGFALVVASYLCLGGFVVANLRHVGMTVVLIGLALNATVIVVNGGMPVRAEAIVATGAVEAAEVASVDFGAKRHLETPADHLTALGDIVPVPVLREVVSFGDLIMAFGAADVVARMLRPRRGRSRSRVDEVDLRVDDRPSTSRRRSAAASDVDERLVDEPAPRRTARERELVETS